MEGNKLMIVREMILYERSGRAVGRIRNIDEGKERRGRRARVGGRGDL